MVSKDLLADKKMKNIMMGKIYKVFVLNSLLFFFPMVISLRSITPDIPINYNETLDSESGKFEAGFFSLGNSQNLYFCIWYKSFNPKTIVWVANRDTPLRNNSGSFKITEEGNPTILDGSGITIWSSNSSTTAEKQKPVLLLLDTGNLVIRNQNNIIVWQSFDYLGDTLLPGMILKTNRISGEHNSLTSWKNTGDPGKGDFSYYIDSHGFPQLFITKGTSLVFRLGSWNGFFFSGIPWETLYTYFTFSFNLTEKEVHYKYEAINDTIVSRYMITPVGSIQRFLWSYQTERWQLFLAGPVDRCDNYNLCGENSNCNVDNSVICECVTGFTPKFPEKWNSSDYNGGCVRKVKLECDDSDGFITYTKMKLPDTSSCWFDEKMNLQDCEKECRGNCSCIAYANLNIRNGGSGCLIWFNNILDMRKASSVGEEIHIRVAASELGTTYFSF